MTPERLEELKQAFPVGAHAVVSECLDEITRLRRALEFVAYTVRTLESRVQLSGNKVDYSWATRLADDPTFLREIARRALEHAEEATEVQVLVMLMRDGSITVQQGDRSDLDSDSRVVGYRRVRVMVGPRGMRDSSSE